MRKKIRYPNLTDYISLQQLIKRINENKTKKKVLIVVLHKNFN